MNKLQKGFSLIEILIVVTILAVLILAGIWSYRLLVPKAQDARRKADLNKLKQVFQDYYNDHAIFPPADVLRQYCDNHNNTTLSPYLKQLPCDPATKKAYVYQTIPDDDTRNKGFRLMAKLSNLKDPAISELNCSPVQGCGLGEGYESYVYGVSEGVPVSTLGSPAQPDYSWWCSPRSSNKCEDWDGSSSCTGILFQTRELCIEAGNSL